MPLGHQLSPCYFHPRSAISTHSTQNHTPDGLITPGHSAGRLTLHSSVITFSRLKHFILAWLERCGHLHPSLLGLNASSSLGASSLPGSNTADIQKSRSGE
ncbi:hypothetical protein PGT21_013112 [Puccinia graminis f. sp. tritici]|uniref:Uncharacterized protein n=1 Tax=Puccinia graminis f. sp. tritici TaxID=56615 RepID=A0A5B0M2M3_PUCGR|nr:hypothetical protein PGT21_013112 [Puccinia graminis f. sp. tritici]